MKTNKLFLLGLVGLFPLLAGQAAPKSPGGHVDVAFFEPQKFTDVRSRAMGAFDETSYLDQLREHLVARAGRYVPAGYALAVTFTDIDMAGDFEPWRGFRWDEIRVVKEIYPPRLQFSFQLKDADGNAVREGGRDLRGLDFMSRGFADDSLRHEKALLDDWLHREFRGLRDT
jgi:hypothetical protein